MLLRRVALGALALLASAGLVRAYDVVTRTTPVIRAKTLAVVGDRCLMTTDQGPVALDRTDVDFYATFRRNLGGAGGNVVVFRTGSLLRFDKLEMKDGGIVQFSVEGGATFTIPESLVDYETSVIEAATVRLPKGAGAATAVSRGGGDNGDFGGDVGGGEYPPEPALAGSPRTRRSGRGVPAAGGGGDVLDQPAPMDTAETAPQDGATFDKDEPRDDSGTNSGRFDSRPTRRQDGPARVGGSDEPEAPGSGSGQTGQVTVVLSTDFSGDIQGLQLLLRYPQTCTPVAPVQFTGFASGLVSAVNTGVNPLNIAGVAGSIGSMRGPGEFLRVNFNWRDSAPQVHEFALLQPTAVDPAGQRIPDFQISLTVQ